FPIGRRLAFDAAKGRLWALCLLCDRTPTNPGALHRLPRVLRLALEMSVHETAEQRALDEELSILERDWREAEEIAAIADGELTPLPNNPKPESRDQCSPASIGVHSCSLLLIRVIRAP